MILQLTGHDYKYAVEQVMLTLFPAERPVYADLEAGVPAAAVRLTHGSQYSTAVTMLFYKGKRCRGMAR